MLERGSLSDHPRRCGPHPGRTLARTILRRLERELPGQVDRWERDAHRARSWFRTIRPGLRRALRDLSTEVKEREIGASGVRLSIVGLGGYEFEDDLNWAGARDVVEARSHPGSTGSTRPRRISMA